MLFIYGYTVLKSVIDIFIEWSVKLHKQPFL